MKRRRGWRERGEGVRKRDVCYILSNLSSWCWGLIAAAKDKWIISCCFHLDTIYCQIAQSQNEGVDFLLFLLFKRNPSFSFWEKKIAGKNSKEPLCKKKKKKNLCSLLVETNRDACCKCFVCFTEIANIFFAQNSLCFFSCTVSSRLLELNPWLHAPRRFKSDYQIRRLWDKSS